MKRVLPWLLVAACGKEARRAEQPPAKPPDAAKVAVADAVPTDPAALQRWLAAGSYKSWSHESATHVSDGPHADEVLTYVSPTLAGSLAAGGAHPRGAASVKELYDEQARHIGWAVSVKLDADSAEGKNWYWFEVFSTAADAAPEYEGQGEDLCVDCHADGGQDFVLIPFPLQ